MTAKVHHLVPPNTEHERITVAEFARRVHRNPKTAYKWIRLKQLPAGALIRVQGHYEIDWTVYSESIRPVA